MVYKKWIWKAKKDYTINVIAGNVITVDDVDVVTKEEIENGDYNREIDAVYDAKGNLSFLMGDFKNTYINSADDALVLIEAYKSQFNTPDNVVFKLNKINNSQVHNTYIFDLYYNDIKLENESAVVVTKIDTSELVKLSITPCEIDGDIKVEATPDLKSHANIIAKYLEENGYTSKVRAVPMETTMNEDGVLYKYIVVFEDHNATYLVTIQNNQVVSLAETTSYTQTTMKDSHHQAQGTGENEKGDSLSFDASYTYEWFVVKKYVLYDRNRNIHCVNNHGTYNLLNAGIEWMESDNWLVSIGGTFVSLLGLAEMGISSNINSNITSNTPTFDADDAIAVQAFDNMQDAYDFYLKEFGLISYDNKGSIIKILNDNSMTDDNASWNNMLNVMAINPAKTLKYSTGLRKEVLAHEYTHAVFNERISGSNTEVNGLNEAYADIMGCLVAQENDWVVGWNIITSTGEEIIFRDIKTINSEMTYGGADRYPEQYKNEKWFEVGEECHAISVMISNIAYKMYASNWFTDSEVAHIWYNSLDYGYDSNSTYVTCRKYVIQAAEDMGCTDGAVDFIAKCFDEANILDPSYVFKTTEDNEEDGVASDGSTTTKTESNAIPGDPIYDDSIQRRYVVMFSPIALVVGDGVITVYEEREGELWFSEDVKMSEKLSEMINEKYPDLNIKGNKIKIDYRTANSKVIDIAAKFCENSKSTVTNLSAQYLTNAGLEQSQEDKDMINQILDNIFKLAFYWQIIESTPYEFYDNLGLIE